MTPGRFGADKGAETPVIYSDAYEVDLGSHVYPTQKYRLVKNRLLSQGLVDAADLIDPGPASDEGLLRVHTEAYLEKIRTARFTVEEQLVLKVPFSPALGRASRIHCGGTIVAGREALGQGLAVHLGGGFHHAFPDHGEGFCLLNDVAVAIRALQAEGSIERAAIVDCDLHQGNGCAAIFSGDDTVFTFSMHQELNYPQEKPPSDMDVGLGDLTDDQDYLAELASHLPLVLDEHGPDLVFYLAGGDPFWQDQLGGLALSRDGLRARDRRVMEAAMQRHIPCAVLLAGGYAQSLDDLIEIHVATVEIALQLNRDRNAVDTD